VRGVWTGDHCAICWLKLIQSNPLEPKEGFTNGHDWLCSACFDDLVGQEAAQKL